MGYDAWLYINKKNHSLKSIEELIVLLGYERTRFGFYYGNDLEYKYNTGVSICEIKKPNDNNYVFHVRAQIWASSYDIELLNRTLRMLKKYCNASFISDNGKNRYFTEGIKTKGAENGCYLAATKLEKNFTYLLHSLSKYPEDTAAEKAMIDYGLVSPCVFNANVYSSYLCALIEDYFRATYIALLKYSDRKTIILSNCKLSAYDLIDINSGNKSLEEAYSRTLSFQNIQAIVRNFKDLDPKLDVGAPLKRPYHKRKENLYEQINRIFERRHRMVHHIDLDSNYNNQVLARDINDIKTAIKRVYLYLCDKYEWSHQEIL